jgi:hypothetical protein
MERRIFSPKEKDIMKDFTKGSKLDPPGDDKGIHFSCIVQHVVQPNVSPAIIRVQNKPMPIVLKNTPYPKSLNPSR